MADTDLSAERTSLYGCSPQTNLKLKGGEMQLELEFSFLWNFLKENLAAKTKTFIIRM